LIIPAVRHQQLQKLSAGGRATVEDSELKSSEIAFACIEASILTVRNSQLADHNTGFYAFNKDNAYGPVKIYADDIVIKKIKTPFAAADDSVIILDGKKIKAVPK
jgi:hypothetical protein